MIDAVSYVVDDVRTLGAQYVACDPRDQSELVVPLQTDTGECFGVLDADSFALGAFDEHDASSMHTLLRLYGLTGGDAPLVRRL